MNAYKRNSIGLSLFFALFLNENKFQYQKLKMFSQTF